MAEGGEAEGSAEPSQFGEESAPEPAARPATISAAESEAAAIPTSWRSDEHEATPSESGEAQPAAAEAAPRDDPARPRRAGWWQRARATMTGE
jgi:ribonuclease E